MNLDRLKYRYWQHTDWHDTNSPLEAVYCNAVDGCDPTIAVSDFEFCTGLKDKNGNLIYEGDVVQDSCNGKGVVRFGNYTGCFAVGWENTYQDLFGWYLDDYYEPDDCGRLRINFDNSHSPITEEDACDLEIIGNIHEQPEQKD